MDIGRTQGAQVGHRARCIALVLRPHRDLAEPLRRMEHWAQGAGVTLVGIEDDPRLPESVVRASEQVLAAGCDVVLALGGDGTMLAALRLATPHAVPTLGINLGTLGYLAEFDRAHLDEALAALREGDYFVETRSALTVAPLANTDLQVTSEFNDVVLSRVPGPGAGGAGAPRRR